MEKQSPEFISHIVKDEVKQFQPIIGKGSVNEIYVVETDSGKVVVRLNNERTIENFLKEKWSIEQAKAKGVRTTDVLNVGEENGTSYMVISFLEGSGGDDASEDKKGHIWHEMGRFAKQIHSISVSGFGLDLVNPEKAEFGGSWDRFLTYNIVSLTESDPLIRLEVLDLEKSAKVKKTFEELKSKDFVFGLNHGDLSLKNTIIDSQGSVSLIDWGEVEAQIVPHFDIGEILRSSLDSNSPEFQRFLEGYGMSRESFKLLEPEIRALMLLRSTDKLRWAIDRHPPSIDQYIKEVKRMLEYFNF